MAYDGRLQAEIDFRDPLIHGCYRASRLGVDGHRCPTQADVATKADTTTDVINLTFVAFPLGLASVARRETRPHQIAPNSAFPPIAASLTPCTPPQTDR